MSDPFARANVDHFFESEFARYARAHFGSKGDAIGALRDFRSVWGVSAPPELALYLRALPETGKVLFAIVPGYGAPPSSEVPEGENLAERLIVQEQEDTPGSPLLMALSGAVRIGSAQNGDGWWLGLYDHVTVKPLVAPWARAGAVYSLEQESKLLQPAIADGLPSFVFTNALSESLVDGGLSEIAFRKKFARLRGRIALTQHFEALHHFGLPTKKERAAFRYKPKSEITRLLFSRSLWIYYLLKNDPAVSVHDIPNFFAEKANEKTSDAIWERYMARVDKLPPTALYVLFRMFFFADEERLNETIARCRKSRSRLIRDAAQLVSELSLGRRSLGTIRDIHELRDELRSKNLDPDRKRTKPAAMRDGRTTKKQREDTFASATRSLAPRNTVTSPEFERALWGRIAEPAALDEAWREMRKDPSLATTFAIVDYIDSDGHVHDNMVVTNEREEALLALSQLGSKRVVPLLLSRAVAGDRKAVDMVGALGDPRSIPHLEGLLFSPSDPYRRLEIAVVSALRRLKAVSTTPTLCRLLEENQLSDWRKGIERGALVREILSTLGALGDLSAQTTLMAALSSQLKEHKELMPLSARALGDLGASNAGDLLISTISSLRSPPSVDFFWALLRISSKHAGAHALLQSLSPADLASEVVRIAGVGSADEFANAFYKATTEPAYRLSDTLERRAWAWRALGERTDISIRADAITKGVTSDEHEVRGAALRSLRTANRSFPEARYYFRVVVDAIEQEGGDAALGDAVADPLGVFRYNAALKLAAKGAPMERVAEVARKMFAEPALSSFDYSDPPHALEWFVRALAKSKHPKAHEALLAAFESKNAQVRALAVEHAPADDRTRPLMKRLLADESALVRGRSEKALARSLGSPSFSMSPR